MNTPNKLTILRMILVPFFLVSFYIEIKNSDSSLIISTIIFAVASITDFFDGYLARKYNLVTDFGKFMDPLADKILVAAAMICLVGASRMPAWMAVLIISREYAISILRAIAAASGKVIAASSGGKIKTVTQIVAIIMLLLNIPFAMYVMIIAVVATFYSGVEYIYKNRHLLTY
ncbi:CDP-diacylglycerol--glycerol-3-phosphate 3-phosphatidyltransferase [Peptoanaerobacter stomatis]|uniref:CDP-diacylglycerol--glycerol-3-phosphate 3-phosphatidyltransferase n=1 Tax=Peptoanaerobacter stomatis TaxID=796937 RepID=UPI003F9FD785